MFQFFETFENFWNLKIFHRIGFILMNVPDALKKNVDSAVFE